ncbi:hypothetical protein GF389_06140 [Candidatus Dojkabacteria bacterium]|nr:hypothetical protein [Candidatus Dojkabacteria bacterium]
MTKIVVARHGETQWNKDGRKIGSKDIPLNGTGRLQAKKLKDLLDNYTFDIAYTSPLSRAQETVQTILQDKNVPIVSHVVLQEIHCGKLEGLTEEEIQKSFNGVKSIDEDFRLKESLPHMKDYKAEMEAFLKRIRKIHKAKSILITSHKRKILLLFDLLKINKNINPKPGEAYEILLKDKQQQYKTVALIQ